ncbi:phage tail assembly protein [Klebsiella pneumoniae]
MTDNETTETTAPASEQPPAPTAVFVDAAKRFRTITLDWPVEFGGTVYSSVTVHRMTTAEVDRFAESVRAQGSKATLPMYDVPREVIDALDPDDAEAVNEATNDFLPRSLRAAG